MGLLLGLRSWESLWSNQIHHLVTAAQFSKTEWSPKEAKKRLAGANVGRADKEKGTLLSEPWRLGMVGVWLGVDKQGNWGCGNKKQTARVRWRRCGFGGHFYESQIPAESREWSSLYHSCAIRQSQLMQQGLTTAYKPEHFRDRSNGMWRQIRLSCS